MYIFNTKIEEAEKLENMLVGRVDTADWLETAATAFAENGLPLRELVIGSKGSGKTHLLRVLYHRMCKKVRANERLVIAYLSEEEYGIDNYVDLLVRIYKAIQRVGATDQEAEKIKGYLEELRDTPAERRTLMAEKFLVDYLNGRKLLILAENLNNVFSGLKESGQSQWRDFIQQQDSIGIVATSDSMLPEVKKREMPFYGFFHIVQLPNLTFAQSVELIERLAQWDKKTELLDYLKSNRGLGDLRAIFEVGGGNHRMLITFFEFFKTGYKNDLSSVFLLMIDKLKPYFQSFLKRLSAQQRKIMQYLAFQRFPQTGRDIAQNNFINATTVSKQMSELQKMGFVDTHRLGKMAYYEIREPMLRISMAAGEDHKGTIRKFIDFLREMYSQEQLASNKKVSGIREAGLNMVAEPTQPYFRHVNNAGSMQEGISIEYNALFADIADRYYNGGDKSAVFELTKEERNAFYNWVGS